MATKQIGQKVAPRKAADTVAAFFGDTAPPKLIMLPLSEICEDAEVQPRKSVDPGTVDHYAELLRDGVRLPPVDVFGAEYLLASGYQRLAAHRKAELKEIEARVHLGNRRDAILFALAANAKHGLPLSPADKRRVVLRMLRDPEWSRLSDREIARRCGVSNGFVSNLRRELKGVYVHTPDPPPAPAAPEPEASPNPAEPTSDADFDAPDQADAEVPTRVEPRPEQEPPFQIPGIGEVHVVQLNGPGAPEPKPGASSGADAGAADQADAGARNGPAMPAEPAQSASADNSTRRHSSANRRPRRPRSRRTFWSITPRKAAGPSRRRSPSHCLKKFTGSRSKT
jgi:hypothetical protein